ncbi:DUF4178 domain-containing protein [Clostridium lundense]|uniref:DUF4178 domain-containing protein n=1 Tax=Clostridium lundense TaxID=319475 RepID=UPI0005525EA9|nr:DUF4178 domain-containing protein [Clostridium lundense]
MLSNYLCFDVGDKIKVDGNIYIVEGYIDFYDDSVVCSWREYRIKSTDNYQVKWLSIDSVNHEYAIYTECCYLEENIIDKDYKKTDSGTATVTEYKGNVDVDFGEIVNYKEYEDYTEEFLISIEDWDGEKEYSNGYYIDEDDIEKVNPQNNNNYTNLSLESTNDLSKGISGKKIIGIIGIIIVAIFLLKPASSNSSKNEIISKYINSNSSFVYVTSITSDLDKNKKANVYSINKTVEGAAKLIIDGVEGKIEDVQENKEDGTVIITTNDELALIYTSEKSEILIQVSSRAYVYSSRNTPYRSRYSTNRYYRSYYYSRAYDRDRNRYSKYPNGYSDYNDETFIPNDNNKYKTYYNNGNKSSSSSIRQDSINSRVSSGGGTSSGK